MRVLSKKALNIVHCTVPLKTDCQIKSISSTWVCTVDSFCYLGDSVCAARGCTDSIITRCRSAGSKFRELLPILTNNRTFSLQIWGRIYSACVQNVMLYASECWAPRNEEKALLERNNIEVMVRWISGVKVQDRKTLHSTPTL